jgi:hypothetical protein
VEDSTAHRPALESALALLLRPLFRVLLRHAVPFGAFAEIAKRVYAHAAMEDFAIPGKKPSISRVSILSGMTRKEVRRVLAQPADAALEGRERYNRAARVLTGWLRDPDYADGWGEPRLLETEGDLGFAGLVRRHSGDMPAAAVLDELLRVGAVARRDDGRLELLTRAYVPRRSEGDKTAILGTDVADLITTIDHNLQRGETDPWFQRKVMYHSVPVAALAAFQTMSSAQSQALLEKLDRWLAAQDTEVSAGVPQPRARVGVGVYYFEERLATPGADSQERP